MERSSFWKKLHQGPTNSQTSPRRRSSIPTSQSMPTALNVPPKTHTRPPQFQSKYPSLPDISPRQMDGQLVPAYNKRGKISPIIRTNSDLEPEERFRQLEMRVAVSEKSNRALLEEVLRLQGDLKGSARHNDDVLHEEQNARRNIENAIKVSNELIQHLGGRIKEAEQKIEEERVALSSLVNHTKGVEQAVKSSQHELVTKKDVQSSRLQEVRADLEEVLQSKQQLERLTVQMADDIRGLKLKVEQHSENFSIVSNELKNKSKKLEEDNRIQLDSLRKQSTLQSQTEHQTSQLRGQVETRLSELREVLVDLRSKHEAEITERRTLENTLSQRVHELQQQLNNSNRKREETMHTVDMILREKEHANAAERMTLTTKVADTVEDVNKKLLTKEIKMREEMQDRYLNLERLIQQEQLQRREYERSTREETDRKWQAIKHAHDELNLELKDSIKVERIKTKETIAKLDESISLLEKQAAEDKRQFEKLISAEITQRKTNTKNISEGLSQMNEKLQIATSSLQQAMGGLTQTLHSHNDKMRRDMRQALAESKDSTTRAMTDLDTRINYLKSRMNENEDKLESRVATKISDETKDEQEASRVLGENLRDKVNAITIWQDTTQSTIKELQTNVTKLPDEIYAVQEKQTLLKNEVDSRMTAESDARQKEVENLKHEIQTLKARKDPQPATIHDLENVQASVRKLADSIQTVKTVLGMKIQSEQKLRISGLDDLQTQVNQIKVNMGMPRYTSMKHDITEGYDTGFASWDDPTPAQSSNPRAITNEGRRSPGNTGMGPIQEGNETKRTNSQASLKNQKSPTPSQGRQHTPTQDKNKTPTPSRNQTPSGNQNKTPSPSPRKTDTPNTGRKSASKKDQQKEDGSGTPRSDEIEKLKEELAVLRTAMEPLLKRPVNRNFVNGNDNDINRHSIANAYRRKEPNYSRHRTKDSGIFNGGSDSDSDEDYDERPRKSRHRRRPSPPTSEDDRKSRHRSSKSKRSERKRPSTKSSRHSRRPRTKSRDSRKHRSKTRSRDRHQSKSRNSRRSKSRERKKDRSRTRSMERNRSRDRNRSRTRSPDRKTSKRSRSRDRKNDRSRSRDRKDDRRSRSRDRKDDRRSRSRDRKNNRSRSPDRKDDKRTRSRDRKDDKRSRSRDRKDDKRSRSRERKEDRPRSKSDEREKERSRSRGRSREKRQDPKKRQQSREKTPDEWNRDRFDKRQQQNKQKEKENRMPTESEDDSDDSLLRKQQRRQNRQIAELF